MNTTEKSLDTKFKAHLNQYPDDATRWSQADDGMRELARSVRQAYNELVLELVEGDEGYVESLNFRSLKTPSAWNTEAKKQARGLWKKMKGNLWAKENALDFIW